VASIAPHAPYVTQRHYILTGRGTGSFQSNLPFPDAGLTYTVNGSAQLADMGQVNVTGSVHAMGFLAKGHATGALTFSNARGSITVELTGLPEQNGFAPLPQYFRYRISAATGQFKSLHETGTLRLDFSSLTANTHGGFRITI
jgi:hypothetical protein